MASLVGSINVIVFACSLGALPDTAASQTAENPVALTAEPSHRVRFDNGKVRVYEVLLQKGEGTLWHVHRADTFSIVFSATEAIEHPKESKPGTFRIPAGFIGFAADSQKPYTHRIVATGDTPIHVVDIELQDSAPSGKQRPPARPDPPFKIAMENTRGRVYRVNLQPGESTGLFLRPSGSGVFALSAGRIREYDQGMERLWDFDPANFRWLESERTASVRNEGTTPIQLIEIEIY